LSWSGTLVLARRPKSLRGFLKVPKATKGLS
jgi:hypothetical protein